MKSDKNKKQIVRRRGFTDEFKDEAVRLMAERGPGVTISQLARDLGVDPSRLHEWTNRKEQPAKRDIGEEPEETLEQENRRLRREVARLRLEQAFAKKVAAYFAKESR
jgi:transposase